MPNPKGQVEMDELSSDMNSYDARVSINEDFHSFLNQLDFSKEERCIGDIIIEYTTEKADNIDINELTLQYANVKPQISGTPEQEMRYAAQQDFIDEIHKDFRGQSGIQNIVGYIAFEKAYNHADNHKGYITESQYEKIHNFIENADECLSPKDIQSFVNKTINRSNKTKQLAKDGNKITM